jgi:hypothetical protein
LNFVVAKKEKSKVMALALGITAGVLVTGGLTEREQAYRARAYEYLYKVGFAGVLYSCALGGVRTILCEDAGRQQIAREHMKVYGRLTRNMHKVIGVSVNMMVASLLVSLTVN